MTAATVGASFFTTVLRSRGCTHRNPLFNPSRQPGYGTYISILQIVIFVYEEYTLN